MNDYLGHGTTSLFAALKVADGIVIASMQWRHRATEFKQFMGKIEKEAPEGLEIRVV